MLNRNSATNLSSHLDKGVFFNAKFEKNSGDNKLKISEYFLPLKKVCAPSVQLVSVLISSYPFAAVIFPSLQKASWQGFHLLASNDHFPTFMTQNVTPHLG